MAKNKVRKKPTAKEMASAIIDINNRLEYLYDVIRGFDSVFTVFLEMEGKKEGLEKRLVEIKHENERKANEEKANEKSNNPNLRGDTDGEGRRTEGVRQESK